MANKEKLQRKMLRDVANILEKHDIPYWLDSATLLGIIRGKNHLSWHNNIDISIMNRKNQFSKNPHSCSQSHWIR